MSEASATRGNPLLRLLLWFRRRCWSLLVWFIIVSAVLVSIGRLLAPYADTARPLIEQFLARALNQPVQIERVTASWPRLSPRIELLGLTVGDVEERLLSVDRARLEFKLYNLVHPGRNSFELVVLGLELAVIQNDRGQWIWELESGGQFAPGWERSVSAGDLILNDSGIRIVPRGLPELSWSVPRAHLNRAGDQLNVRLQASPRNGSGELLDARLVLQMPDSRLESLRGFAESPDFALANLAFDSTTEAIADLRTQMQWWLEWTRDDGGRFHARVDLHSLAQSGVAGRASSRFELDGRWDEQSFRVELNAGEFGVDKPELIDGLAFGQSRGKRTFMARRIELDYLHALVSPWMGSFEFWPESLAGHVRDLTLALNADGAAYLAEGKMTGLQFALQQPKLSLADANLEIGLDGDRIVLRPDGNILVDYPLLYARPLQFDSVSGAVALHPYGFELQALRLDHDEFEMLVSGDFRLQTGEPFIDLAVEIPRLEPSSPAAWLPANGLPPKTRAWLENALLSLESARALTTLYGKPLQWRERIPHGALNSVAEFSGLDLEYARNWPIGEQLEGRIEFLGESLDALIDSGVVAGTRLEAPRIHIPNRRNAELALSLRSLTQDAGALARLTAAFPLEGLRAALETMQWRGEASAQAEIWLPVKHRDDWRLSGRVDFRQAEMELNRQGIGIGRMTGAVPFSRDRFGPATLAGRMLDEPVELDLNAWLNDGFRMSMAGELPIQGLIPADWYQVWPELQARVNGRSHWDIEIGPDRHREGGRDRDQNPDRTGPGLVLELSSDLDGVAVDLPMPLSKQASTRQPFRLKLPLTEQPEPIEFRLEPQLNGVILVDSDYWQVGLGLGKTEARLPSAENFIVEGNTGVVALDQWIDLLSEIGDLGSTTSTPGGGEGLSGWLEIDIDELRSGKTSLGAVELAMNRDADYWRLNSSGANMEGSVRFPARGDADRNIVADLAYLYWPGVDPEQPSELRPPGSVNPKDVPAFDIAIDELRWGQLSLGEVSLSSHKTEQGIEIEQLSARRDGLEISGQGRWTGSGPVQTQMRLRLAADDLGQVLEQAGFDIALERGQSRIDFDGQWPGGPTDFALARVNGELEVVISDGTIPEARPGAGRILGLVSLNSIPRRLRLDFSDVFGGGLGFDRVAGHFKLTDGVASTDDLRIDAPAAEIRISGSTDLEARTYDQVLTVRPGVGSALPIIGALAGGPVGAAAGAALQQIFSKPLKGVSEVKYAVTGTWDNPVFEPVSVRPAENAEPDEQ
ncbi:MAG: YhdP family protein [Wenzhouxiangellaceae bacterium]|nr:YhdP family protein [Wenzhouxiangellaceae bacterium]